MRRVLILLLLATLVLVAVLPTPVLIHASTTPSDIYLVGPGGSGGTTTVATSTANSAALGTSSGVDQWLAESFMVNAGVVSQFTVKFGANTGSPTGTVTWEIDSDNLSIPGTQLNTGTFTPTVSSTNTVTVSSGSFLMDSTTYWLVLKSTTTQAAATSWQVNEDTANPYANGQRASTTNAGGTWSILSARDLSITVSTVSGAPPASLINNKLAQSFEVGAALTTSTTSLYLKKVGAPTGTMTLRIETDGGDFPSGNLFGSNATATVGESTLATSYGMITFTWSSPVQLSANQKYWLVLSTDRTDTSVYVALAADQVCGIGDLKHYTTYWAADQKLAEYNLNSYIPTATPTNTPTATFTPSPTFTPTPTFTPSPTYTPTPVLYYEATLSSGNAFRYDYNITAGDVMTGILLLVVIGIVMTVFVFGLIRK